MDFGFGMVVSCTALVLGSRLWPVQTKVAEEQTKVAAQEANPPVPAVLVDLAFAMGHHPRLGQASGVALLPAELVRAVLVHVH